MYEPKENDIRNLYQGAITMVIINKNYMAVSHGYRNINRFLYPCSKSSRLNFTYLNCALISYILSGDCYKVKYCLSYIFQFW